MAQQHHYTGEESSAHNQGRPQCGKVLQHSDVIPTVIGSGPWQALADQFMPVPDRSLFALYRATSAASALRPERPGLRPAPLVAPAAAPYSTIRAMQRFRPDVARHSPRAPSAPGLMPRGPADRGADRGPTGECMRTPRRRDNEQLRQHTKIDALRDEAACACYQGCWA